MTKTYTWKHYQINNINKMKVQLKNFTCDHKYITTKTFMIQASKNIKN